MFFYLEMIQIDQYFLNGLKRPTSFSLPQKPMLGTKPSTPLLSRIAINFGEGNRLLKWPKHLGWWVITQIRVVTLPFRSVVRFMWHSPRLLASWLPNLPGRSSSGGCWPWMMTSLFNIAAVADMRKKTSLHLGLVWLLGWCWLRLHMDKHEALIVVLKAGKLGLYVSFFYPKNQPRSQGTGGDWRSQPEQIPLLFRRGPMDDS